MLGLRVQKSKRDQKLYAQAALEDATGKIDLICFSRDYERLSGQLKMEAPVLVRGVLMGDDEAAPKIAVSSIQALEEVQVKLPSGVRIRINLERANEQTFAELKSAADAAPGPGKVMLHLETKGRIRSNPGAERDERGGRSGLGGAGRGVSRQGLGAGGRVRQPSLNQQSDDSVCLGMSTWGTNCPAYHPEPVQPICVQPETLALPAVRVE